MAANIGLNEGMVRASKTVLNNLLSDHFVLLAKTWNYHWNVKGVSFHSYHVFMEDLYNGLIEDIDAIAERIRSLDERPSVRWPVIWSTTALKNIVNRNLCLKLNRCWLS